MDRNKGVLGAPFLFRSLEWSKDLKAFLVRDNNSFPALFLFPGLQVKPKTHRKWEV